MSQTDAEFRDHLIEVGRDAMGRNDGWRWWHPRHLARLLDVWEPLIRADATAKALEFCCADTEPDIRKQVAEEIAQAIEAEHVDSGMFCCFSDQRHVALVGAARVARRIGGAS